jgi:hypothetical protein
LTQKIIVLSVLFPPSSFGIHWNKTSLDVAVQFAEIDVGKYWADHASYNVAKKVLEFEFTAEIPRIHLRTSYGEGFKGAPLTCEGSLTRNPGELDDQAAKKERHILGGTRHV